MTQSILILGRQPALGLAEAESLFGADRIVPLGNHALHVGLPASSIPFHTLGGSTRLARPLARIPSTEWAPIEKHLESELLQYTAALPEGKIRLGISTYGLTVHVRRLNATGLQLKKVIKNSGRSVRIVPNKEVELNAGQVLHNQLTGPTGIELLLIKDGDHTVVAQTLVIQDIEAYAARDQARPARDARVGMLPPKLAQIILNMAIAALPQPSDEYNYRILDPFCGTGVILQEAMLMHYRVYGTDLEPRMIDYSQQNLAWLERGLHMPTHLYQLAVGDATTITWNPPVDTIACETYLGRPFSSEPSSDVLREVMQDADTIHRKFLRNVASQTKPGFRLCIAVPAWCTKSGFKHLKTLDSLEELGYNRISFVHVDTRDLIYHRENQVVGRELVVLTRT